MRTFPQKKLYRVSEVAKIFLVTPMHVYRLIYEGKLKALKGKGMVRIPEENVLEFCRKYNTRPRRSLEKVVADIEARKKG